MKQLLFLLVTFLSTASLSSQTYVGSQKKIDNILENIGKFSQYVMAGDYEQIGATYTEDAKIFPNNTDIIAGREAITAFWTPSGDSRTIYHKITPSEIKIIGKEAYDYGYYEGTTRRPNGEEFSWRGKYVIVWKKVGKDWLIYLDIWNRIQD